MTDAYTAVSPSASPDYARVAASGLRDAALVVLACALSACASDDAGEPAPTLAAVDVSFLMPLEGNSAPTAGSSGEFGTLLPRAIFDTIEPLTRIDEPDALYQALRVVAVRLDPCFVEGRDGLPCDSQVRLVLQPVFDSPGGRTTRDAALHAFYAVPVPELTSLADDLALARTAAGGVGDIGVSPIAEQAGALVLKHVGEDRLTRVTFVSVHASDEAWSFGGFDVVEGVPGAVGIPGVTEHAQHLSSMGRTQTLDAAILPAPLIEPAIDAFLRDSTRAEMTAEEIDEAVAALNRLLDPAVHNPGTVDCASCHMATAAVRFASPAGHSGIGPAYADTRNQRMFGWYGAMPSVSLRVDAETTGVLAAFLALR